MNKRQLGKRWLVHTGLITATLAVMILGGQLIWATPAPVAAEGAIAASVQGYEYVGSKKCKACHLVQYKSWEKTRMANNFDLLKPGERADAKRAAGLDPEADYTTDETCLECHTVGYGQPGGFVSLKESSDLVGTGCEACHGAGSGYTPDNVMGNSNKKHSFEEVIAKGLVYPVPEEQCRNCHNERSPFTPDIDPKYEFVYSKERLTEQTHRHRPLKYKHGPLPEGTLFQKQR